MRHPHRQRGGAQRGGEGDRRRGGGLLRRCHRPHPGPEGGHRDAHRPGRLRGALRGAGCPRRGHRTDVPGQAVRDRRVLLDLREEG